MRYGSTQGTVWQQLDGSGVLLEGVMLGAGRRIEGSSWLRCLLILFFFVGFSFVREVLKIGGLRGWRRKQDGSGVLEVG